jgi:hypothetical protein
MALVTQGNGSGFYLTVTLIDSQNDKSTLEYEMTSADYATAVTDSATILAALAGVTDASVSTVSISFRREEAAFAYPATLCNNSEKARIVVQLAGSTKKAVVDIPAPKNAIFVAPVGDNNNIVDLGDDEVIAYVQLFQADGESFISDGEVSAFGVRGEKVTSRKGMSRG